MTIAKRILKINKVFERVIETYEELLKLILKSSSRQDFERKMMIRYSEQVHLAMEYAQKVFGKDFPPY